MYNHAHNVIECPWEAFGLHAKAIWWVFDFKYYSLCIEKYLRISLIRMINQHYFLKYLFVMYFYK